LHTDRACNCGVCLDHFYTLIEAGQERFANSQLMIFPAKIRIKFQGVMHPIPLLGRRGDAIPIV